MKRFISLSLAVAILAAGVSVNAFADPSPGEVDFGKFAAPGKDGKFVEINIKRNLLSLAAKLVEQEQPDAARLLRSVQLIRVNVVGLTGDNRSEMEKRVREIRSHLDQQGWERIVTAQEKNGEDVGVYVKTRGEESLEGLVVTVLDGKKKEAVLINIVGDIKPEQVAAVGKVLNLDPLQKAGEQIKK